MDFKHFSISDVGMTRRGKNNEDSYGDRMTANGYVFVVCDGMGGHVGGATASRLAVDSILDFFENPVQNIYVGINEAFQVANNSILAATEQDPSLKGMGTTGTILVINQEACFIGHVGDSRIYLKSDGRLNRLTKDHSFVQGLVDQGIISDDEAESHPQKNQILAALGIKPQVSPTICDAPIQPKVGDCFLLCSDGLNGMIHDRVIEELIDPNDVERSGKALIDAANNAGGKDNITATLVSITESPFASSIFTHFNPVPVAAAATTIIEPMIGEEPKKSKKKLWFLLGSFALILIAVLLWFFVFNKPDVTDKKVPPVEDPTDSLPKRDSVMVGDKKGITPKNITDLEKEKVKVDETTIDDPKNEEQETSPGANDNPYKVNVEEGDSEKKPETMEGEKTAGEDKTEDGGGEEKDDNPPLHDETINQ